MKHDEIIAKWNGMAPRERDAWVAEVVFNKKIGRERRIGGAVYEIGYGNVSIALDEYTKDISAAWSVLNYLRANWLTSIQDCDVFGWRVDLQSDSEYRGDIGGIIAPTAPAAICLAAIIASLETSV